MSTETKNVQVRIDFITDENRKFAGTILQTEKFNKELRTSQAELVKYRKALAEAGNDEVKRAAALENIALAEQKVANAASRIAVESRKISQIDLTKLTPAQLVERAKQLDFAIRNIPRSAPQFAELEAELIRVNGQLGEMRSRAKGIEEQGQKAGGQPGLIGSVIGRVAGFAAVIGAIIATLRGLFNFVSQALTDFDEGAKADEALKSRIESTQGAAGRTFEQLKEQANELQKITLFGDENIQKGQELLLTFTNVRDEILDRTVPAMLDLSTVFGQDVSASAVQLGKALNDPVGGITALRRVGITFSEDQQRMIKSLVDTGDVAGAQTIILQELERQVGGAAKAAAEAGLGPFQLIQRRFGEVKESLGGLIEQGLVRLRPLLEGAIVFLEGLTDALVSGDKATGKYADGINFTIGLLKFIAGALNIVYQALKFQYEIFSTVATRIAEFIEAGQRIPLVGEAINFVLAPLRLLYDAITNLPATWTGVVAAVKQGAENLSGIFQALVLRAQIFAKELDLSLSIRQDTKDRLTRELGDLKAKQGAIAAGRTIGEAYSQARDAAIAAAGAGGGTTTGGTKPVKLTVGGLSDEDAAKRRDQLLENELKGVEAAALRREVILENARLKDEVNETAYQNRLIDIKKQKLQEQLDVYRKFKREETVEALKVQNELLRLEADTTRPGAVAPLAAIGGKGPGQVTSQKAGAGQSGQVLDVGKDLLLRALQDKFEAALISEQDYELQKLELKRQFLDMELEQMRAASQPQTEEIKKREEEKAKIEEEIGKKRLENEQRLEDLRRATLQTSIQTTQDFFSAVAESLSADENARKKNASAIKAFQSGAVIASGVAEVAKIWEKSAEFGPLQSVIAAIQTAAAVLRTTTAVRKIAATKFARGTLMNFFSAKMGFFGGKPHSQGGTKGYFDDGTEIEVEKHEAFAVVNKRNAPLLRLLSSVNALGGNGVPFFQKGGAMRFDTGGLPNINTTPVSNFFAPSPFQAMGNLEGFINAVGMFQQIVAGFPREVAAKLSYLDLEKTGSELDQVRSDAAV